MRTCTRCQKKVIDLMTASAKNVAPINWKLVPDSLLEGRHLFLLILEH